MENIKVNSSAVTFGLMGEMISAVVSIVLFPLLLLGLEVEVSFNYIFSVTADDFGGKLLLLLVNPIWVFAITYCTTAIGCISYNGVSKLTGGMSYSEGD